MKTRFVLIYNEELYTKKAWELKQERKKRKKMININAKNIKEAIKKTKNLNLEKLFYYDFLDKKFYDLEGNNINIPC